MFDGNDMPHSTYLDWHEPQMIWLYKTEPLVELIRCY